MLLVFLYLNILSSLFSFDLRQDSHTNYRVIKPTTNKPPCGCRWLLLLIPSVRVSLSKPTTQLVWIISSGSSKVQRCMQSWQEDVQERAPTGLATFVVICWRKCQHRLWYSRCSHQREWHTPPSGLSKIFGGRFWYSVYIIVLWLFHHLTTFFSLIARLSLYSFFPLHFYYCVGYSKFVCVCDCCKSGWGRRNQYSRWFGKVHE